LARVVLATARVPDEDGGGRLLVRAKSNLGPDGGGFRYDLRIVPLDGENSGISAARPEWLGPLEGEARQLLAAAEVQRDPEERSAASEAAEALREILQMGRIPTKDARRKLKADGFTDKQIRRARESLGIVRVRDGYGGPDYWRLPDIRSCPIPVVHAQPQNVGINGHQRKMEGTNDDPLPGDEAALMALVDRIATHFNTPADEIAEMREIARKSPHDSWPSLLATAAAVGLSL